MVERQDTPAKLWQLLDHARGLLDQGWFYKGSYPGRDQSECRVTECLDLLGLLAELVGDVQRMGEACEALADEGKELGIPPADLRKLLGVDLARLAAVYTQLAKELSTAGNRAIDSLSGTAHTERQSTAPEAPC
jgi:hypothetical protein